MADDENIVENKKTISFTYMTWLDHARAFFQVQWKKLAIYSIAIFGVMWGVIEAASFFAPNSNLGNSYILSCIISLCALISLSRCIHDYKNRVPIGLEKESSTAHKIAINKKHFWEYALAKQLIENRIKHIDDELDDITRNRTHVKITRKLDIEEYIQWMQTRPQNLLGFIKTAQQLLIFDLIHAIHTDEDNEADLKNLVKVANLVEDLYRSIYDYEIEGREIIVPEEFELAHEIQSTWGCVTRDSFHQMLKILNGVATRNKNDLSPIRETITFEKPPRLDEYISEVDKIRTLLTP